MCKDITAIMKYKRNLGLWILFALSSSTSYDGCVQLLYLSMKKPVYVWFNNCLNFVKELLDDL